MLVQRDERVPLARLLQFLEHGERLAHDCSQTQAALAPDARMRRFLLGQTRQEALHVAVCQAAIAWLAPRHLGDCPVLAPLERYRARLAGAMQRRNFIETILAEQVILEGLGEAILKRIDAGLVKRQAAFAGLRRILLHQEEAHHAFGCRVLVRAIAVGETSAEALRALAFEYLAMTDEMVTTLCDLFDAIDEDSAAYVADARRSMPEWLKL